MPMPAPRADGADSNMRKAYKTPFAAGQRVRMNILPMFLVQLLPIGVFMVCSSAATFQPMHKAPIVTSCFLAGVFFVCFVGLVVALWQRRRNPAPTWYSYVALMSTIGAISGTIFGLQTFRTLSQPYYEITDLKVIGHLIPSIEYGQDVLDAGIVYFADGSIIDRHRSWHFKQDTVYCVAPVVSNRKKSKTSSENVTEPATQSYDFWVVGKDCCAVGGSDFRCGAAWHAAGAHSAIRALDAEALKYYRLAVEQAKSLYGMAAAHPIFFYWSSDPVLEVHGWMDESFRRFLFAVCSFCLFSLITLVFAIGNFSMMGRARSALAFAEWDFYQRQNLFYRSQGQGYGGI